MTAVEKFVTEAEAFSQWAAAETTDNRIDAAASVREALRRLTRLYAAALELPAVQRQERRQDESPEVSHDEWKRVFTNKTRLPFDLYGQMFNPLIIPPEREKPVISSLSDDIAGIYRDVETGLRYFRAGNSEKALWEWTLNFRIHWGRHATSAIRALHCWLQEHDDSRLIA